MALAFRNIDVCPSEPVAQWGVEGILAAIDRGHLEHWRRIARAVRADPHGQVASDLTAALRVASSTGTAAALRRVLDAARRTEPERIARRVRDAIHRSGMSAGAFAGQVGTSASRLSTYATGKVVPSAVTMDRIERAARQSFL